MATETNTPELKKFLSLYDYLGRAAGPKLGSEVAQYAARLNEPQGPKNQVDNPKYKGPINTFHPDFLDFFFTRAAHKAVIKADLRAFKAKQAKKNI